MYAQGNHQPLLPTHAHEYNQPPQPGYAHGYHLLLPPQAQGV
jgi:hypothetical protein